MTGNHNQCGFTLIETIVTISIFALIALSITSLFLTVVKANRQGLAMAEINQESQIVLERMSKEIRMATINSATNPSATTLSITTNTGTSVNYTFDSTAKTIERNSQVISSNKVEITNGKFYIVNNTYSAPYVTINFQISDINYPTISKIVQTTISPRSGNIY